MTARKRFSAVTACATLVFLSADSAHAQKLEPGTRVRIRAARVSGHFYGRRVESGDWIVGTLESIEGAHVRLLLEHTAGTVSVHRDSIARMEQSLGMVTREKSGRRIGMLTGALVGAAGGAALVFALDDCRNKRGSIGDAVGCGAGAVTFGLLGAGVFGWLGYVWGRDIGRGIEYEKWERLPGWEHRLSIRMNADPRRSRYGVALAFNL